jgi:hypothetical protein
MYGLKPVPFKTSNYSELPKRKLPQEAAQAAAEIRAIG